MWKFFKKNKTPISDTVTVTADGRTVVDVEKLFAKPHIKQMLRDIRAKTVYIDSEGKRIDNSPR